MHMSSSATKRGNGAVGDQQVTSRPKSRASFPVRDTASHLVAGAGRPLGLKRLRRRGPRSFDSVFRRSLRSAMRSRGAVDDVAAPLLDECGGATALLAVHAGSTWLHPTMV